MGNRQFGQSRKTRHRIQSWKRHKYEILQDLRAGVAAGPVKDIYNQQRDQANLKVKLQAPHPNWKRAANRAMGLEPISSSTRGRPGKVSPGTVVGVGKREATEK